MNTSLKLSRKRSLKVNKKNRGVINRLVINAFSCPSRCNFLAIGYSNIINAIEMNITNCNQLIFKI